MIRKYLLSLLLLLPFFSASAQPYVIFVIDKQAIAKSSENLALNLIKQQQYKKTLDLTEDIFASYTRIEMLQQQVLDDLKKAESIRDLHWADLSKSLYLANELVKGVVQPGLEVDYVIDHPLFENSPDRIYRDLFLASSADPLPDDLTAFRQAKQSAHALSSSFESMANERKTYAAVAFQYLAEDLILKSTEMNEVLKQPTRFSMTEAERMRLQSFSEDYLQLASEMLERSDKFLLEVAQCRSLQHQTDQQQKELERTTIANTIVLDY
ncbi:hypothetical protein [Catalinimonas niigatensis]|uniref:hypothetical protein n=1 Tax=Catalinimonas niigatensis TaxID=1397264 RepID=UPI0026658A56|nr:hypothetical protein [Catalinimonas niigatensis]WPP51847.1 hypothetical protein PZB72_05530 [Catalinimonas niigatensis]